MQSLDTNCLLRWLLDDMPKQTALVSALFSSGKSLAVADVALIETIFVLEKIKKISRKTIEKAVLAIIGKETIFCSRDLFIETLSVYTAHPKLSLVDCYLETSARRTKAVPLLTFDQKLANQLSGAELLSQ